MPPRIFRLVRLPGVGRPCLPGFPPIRSFSSSATRSTSEVEQVLRGQDSHPNRIMFLPPKRYGSLYATSDYLKNRFKRSFPEASYVEAHLLPFYTVDFLTSVESTLRNKRTGEHALRSSQLYSTSYGLTMAAVPIGHWAHGIAISEDLPFIAEELDATSKFAIFDNTEALVASTSADFYFAKGEEAYLPQKYDPRRAPLFAFGPPKLEWSDLQQFVEPQCVWKEMLETESDMEHLEEYMRMIGEPTLRSFPHYRMVFKADMGQGRIAFIDMSTKRGHSVFSYLPEYNAPAVHPIYSNSELVKRSRMARSVCNFEEIEHISNDGIIRTIIDREPTSKLHNLLVRAMTDNPVTKGTWKEPRMFPIAESRVQLAIVENQLRLGVVEKPTKRAPEVAAAPVSSHLRSRAPRQPQSHRRKKVEPEPSASKGSAAPGQAKASFIDERKKNLAGRLWNVVNQQKAWQGHPVSRLQPAKPAIPSPKDPKGYYRILAVKPRADFIQKATEAEVNKELRLAFYELSRANHPDRAETEEEENRMTKVMAEINVAYSEVDEWEKRVAYSKK